MMPVVAANGRFWVRTPPETVRRPTVVERWVGDCKSGGDESLVRYARRGVMDHGGSFSDVRRVLVIVRWLIVLRWRRCTDALGQVGVVACSTASRACDRI
jgi:hypothetical protein